MSRCPRCDGPGVVARGRTAAGAWQVFRYCTACGKRIGTDNIAHRLARDIESLLIAWDHSSEGQVGPCDTCFRVRPLQYHHIAPRHLFGDEAELWPGVMLCEECHKRWHRMVTPLMSQPNAVGEILAALPADSPVAAALAKAEAESKRARARKITPAVDAEWRARRAAAKRKGAA